MKIQDCSRFMQIGSQMPYWFRGSPLQLKPLLQTGIHNNLWHNSAPQIYLCTNVYISCAYVCKLFNQIILQGFKFHEISTSTSFTEFKYHKKPTIQYVSSSFMATWIPKNCISTISRVYTYTYNFPVISFLLLHNITHHTIF